MERIWPEEAGGEGGLFRLRAAIWGHPASSDFQPISRLSIPCDYAAGRLNRLRSMAWRYRRRPGVPMDFPFALSTVRESREAKQHTARQSLQEQPDAARNHSQFPDRLLERRLCARRDFRGCVPSLVHAHSTVAG